jgi:hypothetical protein
MTMITNSSSVPDRHHSSSHQTFFDGLAPSQARQRAEQSLSAVAPGQGHRDDVADGLAIGVAGIL